VGGVFVAALAMSGVARGQAPEEAPRTNATQPEAARMVVHLLDYLAKDYAGAVGADGNVLSESEFAEQQEFAETASKTATSIPEVQARPALAAALLALQTAIHDKASPDTVVATARTLQAQVIEATHLVVSPRSWPSVARGAQVFAANCASCHGPQGQGDGPAGVALDPKPANFHSPEMRELAPLAAFNTIRLGVPGTGMPAFPQFSGDEAWDVAFYVVALRYAAATPTTPPSTPTLALHDAATKSDAALTSADATLDLAALRTYEPSPQAAAAPAADSLAIAERLLAEAKTAYEAGDVATARTRALSAYLEGIEPVEPHLRATDPAGVATLEAAMAAVRAAIEAKAAPSELAARIDDAVAQIAAARRLMQSGEFSPALAFTAASAILLREGFEAVLMILALLSVIRATGQRRAALWVHGGWIAALALGFVAWIFSGYLVDFDGAHRELMEGLTSLLAVVVLLVAGFWLHRRTEIGRWNYFLKTKVRDALDGGRLAGLALVAFMAVFREALETVLFLRAVWLEGGQPAHGAIGTAVLGTLAVIIVGAWAVLRFSARIPVRKLFAVSSVVMAVLAVILTGKGLHSLQETGLLGVTALPLPLRSDFVGVYPTAQTFAPQLAMLLLVLGLWWWGRLPSARSAPRTAP
jgi:high-affinity iron transporter